MLYYSCTNENDIKMEKKSNRVIPLNELFDYGDEFKKIIESTTRANKDNLPKSIVRKKSKSREEGSIKITE